MVQLYPMALIMRHIYPLFKMDLIHSGSGLTSVNLDDILVADDGMAALANQFTTILRHSLSLMLQIIR